jgi:hypothetical protein
MTIRDQQQFLEVLTAIFLSLLSFDNGIDVFLQVHSIVAVKLYYRDP